MTHDPALDRAIALLDRLVSFDTESSRSNLGLINFVEDYLLALGASVIRVPNAPGDKAALFATFGPATDGGVVLSGHTDVVPVAGQKWTSPPFVLRRDGDRLYGRGTCDMKGFDAICLAMAPEFMAAPLKKPIHIMLSYDEETTCAGCLDAIRRFGHDLPRPALALIGEPTLMQVADAHKSVATYRTSVTGHEAHSSKPWLGVSAVHIACELVMALERIGRELESERDPLGRFDPAYSTVHVGVIQGGTARNIMARQCDFYWEFRGLPQTPQNRALEKFEAFCAALAAERFGNFPAAKIETFVETEAPGLCADPDSAAATLAMKLAQANHTIAVPYATEAGQFQASGLPAVICGPGSIDQAHQPDEFIDIGQLAEGLAFLRRLAGQMSN
ncbi:acetylornithine deacetylase [Rhodoblastus acidophilus]|uniref:Acetylornithine deacetylase n=1 Tax=Candidatus Rhodoblastus alkanivorans TaxID=2954117 RepID=A0ABS9ZB13_9HYPH|nr:acetylornithine deacetylase [Candidatus Rhodoblastus alkanivorans]MCI4679352.1 acetylornithine deacetylase [Candidatus Rhodoblastus alkanivorans]MCI4684828.1 acetylornithine deacetylase [Candidatus Rhodoblastus alkanivorans]MDI4642152.1 acetylornithine deacetylase [Rhodoblastus acidophilus]